MVRRYRKIDECLVVRRYRKMGECLMVRRYSGVWYPQSMVPDKLRSWEGVDELLILWCVVPLSQGVGRGDETLLLV